MSKIFNIITAEEIVKEDLFHTIHHEIPTLKGEIKSDEGLYFYSEGTSIRGIDFWKVDNGYEVKINGLSTKDDYKIAAIIIQYFRKMQEHGLFKDLKYTLDGEPYSFQKAWFRDIENDYDFDENAKIIKQISDLDDNIITIFGPTREAHIGPFTLSKVGAGKPGWQKRLHAHLLKVMYQLPKNESDNVLAVKKENGEEIILKLIAENVQYVLGKYDYIVFSTGSELELENMIVVTHDILNENLHKTWERIDDYTIVARRLNKEEYSEYVSLLKEFDCKEEVFGKINN